MNHKLNLFAVCMMCFMANWISAQAPATAAATPTATAANVISLFSNAYTNRTVDTWSAVWDQADVNDVQIAGNDTKKYTNLVYSGIEFTTSVVDATAMTFLHLDIWTPNATNFKVKLVDFGANGIYQGSPNDDSEFEVTVAAPAQGAWVAYDIPMSNFTGLTARAHLAQMILSSSNSTVYVDNVYFYKSAAATMPATAAATPTRLAANVVSMFSNAYTNRTVDTWSAVWDQADVNDVQIAGNDTKQYSNLNYAGIEFTTNVINAADMGYLHLDVWTPDATNFKVKLVDFGANGVWQGNPNDDSEFEVTVAAPAQGSWVAYDIPLSDFTSLKARAHLAQMILSSSNSTVYVDNVYFYKNPPADPTLAIFTDAYATGVTFAPFGGSVNDVTVDSVTVAQAGVKSLKVVVPAAGYTGGAFAVTSGQNLSTYNAVTFWVKASAAHILNTAGLGNNAAKTDYQAEMMNIPVTTTWTKVIIPIPVPAKLSAEMGLFHFAEGSDEGAYTIWFDNIQYENISGGLIGTPTAAMANETINKAIGDAFSPNGLTSSFPVNGVAKTVIPKPGYFTFTSSTPAVATMSALGVGSALSAGTTNITAMLGAVAVTGTLTVNVAAVAAPATAAPTPTRPAASVLSLFSNAYRDTAGTNWNPNWNQTTVVSDIQIAGNDTKKYANLNYQGVEFAKALNVTAMNYLHLDLWTPNCTSFKVFLINTNTSPATEQAVTLKTTLSGWNSFDIALSDYNTINKTMIAQLKLEGTPAGSVVYLDNIFFFKTGVGTNDLTFSNHLFTVNPTLANDFVHINLNENVQGATQITFTTLMGQKMYEENLNVNHSKTSTISTQNLPSGIYLVGVRTGTSFQSQKIVITH
ncbi:MAG: hypothetical protein RLZZ628_3983 [Bacteroidota bacterium]